MIRFELTADEFANTQSALEEYLTALELADDPSEDQAGEIASVRSALARLDAVGARHFA